MRKVYIANPDNKFEQYRLVINATEDYSVGIELHLEEINQLYYELRDLIEVATKKKNKYITT